MSSQLSSRTFQRHTARSMPPDRSGGLAFLCPAAKSVSDYRRAASVGVAEIAIISASVAPAGPIFAEAGAAQVAQSDLLPQARHEPDLGRGLWEFPRLIGPSGGFGLALVSCLLSLWPSARG
jgi:hypothetical protein